MELKQAARNCFYLLKMSCSSRTVIFCSRNLYAHGTPHDKVASRLSIAEYVYMFLPSITRFTWRITHSSRMFVTPQHEQLPPLRFPISSLTFDRWWDRNKVSKEAGCEVRVLIVDLGDSRFILPFSLAPRLQSGRRKRPLPLPPLRFRPGIFNKKKDEDIHSATASPARRRSTTLEQKRR